jgi:hypothetical protein
MTEAIVCFFAGLAIGSFVFLFFYLTKATRVSASRIESLENENQILHSKLDGFRNDIMELRRLEIDNAKLKYQAEAANTVAKP